MGGGGLGGIDGRSTSENEGIAPVANWLAAISYEEFQ